MRCGEPTWHRQRKLQPRVGTIVNGFRKKRCLDANCCPSKPNGSNERANSISNAQRSILPLFKRHSSSLQASSFLRPLLGCFLQPCRRTIHQGRKFNAWWSANGGEQMSNPRREARPPFVLNRDFLV